MKKNLPEKLRVCIVSQKFPRSELADDCGYLWPLAKNLATRGHDITVITNETHDGPSVQSTQGIQIHYLTSSGGEVDFKENILDTLEELHFDKPFDLIHSVDHTGISIALHKKSLNVALAVDVNVVNLDEVFGIIGLTEETLLSYVRTSLAVGFRFLKSFFGDDHRILSRADGIFVASPQQLEILERYYYIPSIKVHIIPFGIEAHEFEPTAVKPEILSQLGIDEDTKVILTISPMTSAEETKNLLSSFERVVIKKPKTALLIVGDGPKRFELEAHMLSLALASKVHFTGAVPPDQLTQYINACDVYVSLYSRSSGFEPTVLEAMACCKAVIASEIGTSRAVIENGVDGFIVRPTEIASLARLMLQLVSGQIDTKAIGERTRQKILKMFDTTRMVDETIHAYRGILLSTGKYKK